jgi:trans-2-enoyl-CoA reductase
MNQDELLQRLNKTPIKLHVELMKLRLRDFNSTIQSTEEFIKREMQSKGMDIQKEFMKEANISKYINQHIINKYKGYEVLDENMKIDLHVLEEMFPSEPLIIAYSYYRNCYSLKQRYEYILRHEKNGYIQPIYAINSIGNIYTSKPPLQLSQTHLKQSFDCDSFTFDSLEKAIKAIKNAKEDTEIITVLKSTVYYRNNKYKHEKEKRRQDILKMIDEQCSFMPLEAYYDEFTLEELGY